MAKVNVSDGDNAPIGLAKSKENPQNFNKRLDGFAKVQDLNPDDCPESMVPMLCGKNTRVACTSGNIYLFAAGKIKFVHERDADTCGGRGAVKQDAAAIAERAKVEADARELAELRAEKKAKKEAAAKEEAAVKEEAAKKEAAKKEAAAKEEAAKKEAAAKEEAAKKEAAAKEAAVKEEAAKKAAALKAK